MSQALERVPEAPRSQQGCNVLNAAPTMSSPEIPIFHPVHRVHSGPKTDERYSRQLRSALSRLSEALHLAAGPASRESCQLMLR